MAELMAPTVPHVIGINAALEPFSGLAGVTFPLIAKTIAALPLVTHLFSATANEKSVAKIIKGTGSTLPPEDLAFYQRLVASRSHVNATLKMMAQWKLDGLLNRLPRNHADTLFIVGENDRAVPPATSQKAASIMPNATCNMLPDLGHLAHEEDPDSVAALIRDALHTVANTARLNSRKT